MHYCSTIRMNPKWISYALMFYTFISLVHLQFTKDPLIFDPYTREIYDLKNIASSPHDGLFAVACPAYSEREMEFNTKESFDQKALFVSNLLKKDEPRLQTIKCDMAYSMAVIYHKRENHIRLLEFGYEVYYEGWRINFQKDFQWDHSNVDFGQAEEINSRFKRIQKFFSRSYLPDMDMRFLWISKVILKYNRSKWHLEWVWYSMELKMDQLHATCKNFNLGLRLYRLNKKQSLGEFYSAVRQKEIFGKLQLPESVDGICKTENKCVDEYDLVAPYRFQTSVSGRIQCSKLTSIPIWYKRTRDLLDFTEKFLIALSQMVENRIEVTTGAHDVLAFPKKDQKKPKLIPIYMDSKKNRLPVPKILYRTISSQNPDCDTQISECLYVVVIIIHNGPEISPKERLCEDRCKEWGWDSVQYSSTIDKKEKSQFIYCCELDKSLREKLNYSKKTSVSGILNLKRYPDYNGKNESPDRVNPDIQDEVENKIYVLDQISPKLYHVLGLLTK